MIGDTRFLYYNPELRISGLLSRLLDHFDSAVLVKKDKKCLSNVLEILDCALIWDCGTDVLPKLRKGRLEPRINLRGTIFLVFR